MKTCSSIDSLGYFYGSITKLLGFKPHSHEGKVLGLAAYGNPNKAYKYISKMISYDKINKTFKGNYVKNLIGYAGIRADRVVELGRLQKKT